MLRTADRLGQLRCIRRRKADRFKEGKGAGRSQVQLIDPLLPGGGQGDQEKLDTHLRVPSPPFHDERAEDRKSTRLNSSHVKISYAVFCLKKKKKTTIKQTTHTKNRAIQRS